ncbi:hypothetical protein N2152v2_005133 [Parachlorella kessleri]
MLDEDRLRFSQQLAQQPTASQPGSWTHPQLVTRDLFNDCKGPDAEWLLQSSGGGGVSPTSLQGGAGTLPAVVEEGIHDEVGQAAVAGGCLADPVSPVGSSAGQGYDERANPLQQLQQQHREQPLGQIEQQEQPSSGSSSTPSEKQWQQQTDADQQLGPEADDYPMPPYGDDSTPLGGLGPSPLSSPDELPLQDGPTALLHLSPYSDQPAGGGVGQHQQGYPGNQQPDQLLRDASCSSLVTSLSSNPVFEADESSCAMAQDISGANLVASPGPLTPAGRGQGGQPSARITPGSTDPDHTAWQDPATPAPSRQAAGAAEGIVGAVLTTEAPAREAEGEWPSRYGPEQAGERPARNLEAQLLSVGGAAAPMEAVVAAQLRRRLEAAEAEATQLREEKAASDLRAAALLDEVQLSFAALEASQRARRESEAQLAQSTAALRAALAEQRALAAQAEAGRQELAAALEKVDRLEYQVELMQAERQEGGLELAMHSSITISPDASLESLAGGELMAEVEALRAALAEANRSKAALASRLQQARAEGAALAARLQASQARRSAEVAAQAAAARQAGGEAWAEVAQLRAEKQQLEVQVQLLQRQAAGSRETERGAALAGIIRQREEQLVAAHLEMAQLQARVRELAASEERCGALEARVALLLAQHAALTDKLHSAQAESAGWRDSLGRLSDELTACSAREAGARSALTDTATRLVVQQQLCEAQGEELELLRAKLVGRQNGGGSSEAAQQQLRNQGHTKQQQQQQDEQGEQRLGPLQVAQQHTQQRFLPPQQAATQLTAQSTQDGPAEAGSVLDGWAGFPLAGGQSGPPSSKGPRSLASSEDDGSPRSRKSSSSGKFSWLKFKSGHH